jgi:nitrile hydratase
MTRHDSEHIADIHRELHSHLPPEPALRAKALESLLVEKGMVDPAAVDAWIERYSEEIGPRNGARIVARAWVDPGFRRRLLDDAAEAIKELGLEHDHLIAVENARALHNLVCCTLCSCYPNALLGMPPSWYKMAAYRARAVRDPRGVLEEFGVALDPDVEIRVWDSTAELRFIVIPQRPAGTEGWDEERLAGLVTRNAMIGTARDLSARVQESS